MQPAAILERPCGRLKQEEAERADVVLRGKWQASLQRVQLARQDLAGHSHSLGLGWGNLELGVGSVSRLTNSPSDLFDVC